MIEFPNNIIVGGLDLETTGLSTPDHRIIETFTGLYKGEKELKRLDQRIDPERSIAADAQRVHHISSTDLIGKPKWPAVAPVQQAFIAKSDLIVIHNAEFDWGFLEREFERIGMKIPNVEVFCTMENGVWATNDGKKPSLKELCFACGVPYSEKPGEAHAASYDVEVMMQCFFTGVKWGYFQLPASLTKS